MNISRFLTVVSACAAITLVSSCSNTFTVNGKISEDLYQDGLQVEVYAEDLAMGENLVQTVDVKEDGTFSIKGQANKMSAFLALLTCNGYQYGAFFIAERGKVNVTITPDNVDVKGGRATNAFNKLQKDLSNVMNTKQEDYNYLLMHGTQAQYDSLREVVAQEQIALYQKAMESNPNNFVGLVSMLDILSNPKITLEQADNYLAKAPKSVKENVVVKEIYESIKASSATSVGQKFVDFGGVDFDGQSVSLSDYVGKGKYVLADFWASWCGSCMEAIPTVASLYEKYADKGLQVVGVNVWENKEGDGQKCYKEKNMTWPVMFVSSDEATNSYGITGIPTLILFSPDGTILEKLTGESGVVETVAKFLGE